VSSAWVARAASGFHTIERKKKVVDTLLKEIGDHLGNIFTQLCEKFRETMENAQALYFFFFSLSGSFFSFDPCS